MIHIDNEIIKKIIIALILVLIISSIIYGTKNIKNTENPKINFENYEIFKKIPMKISKEEFDKIIISENHVLIYFPDGKENENETESDIIDSCIRHKSFIEYDNKFILPLGNHAILLPNNKWKWSNTPMINFWEKVNVI